ncbi:uncharacterized protein LOC122450455 isoform X2 [Cervus canadensis]|uniref:uncharacterized protein LOC122450455 isoform X2 n=1 Tax=Cervus canadensis TaxID=1574408 RepID=UPI001C9E38DE|nr:uncharacterized protein LOC122450455 isoform X2 [Cervus canadensis]
MDAAAEITARTFGAPHTDPSAPARPSPLLPAPGRGPAWPPRAGVARPGICSLGKRCPPSSAGGWRGARSHHCSEEQSRGMGGRWAPELLTFGPVVQRSLWTLSHFLLASFSLSLPRTPPPASPGSSILLTTGKAETGCPETLHSGASEARLRPGSAQRARRVGGGDGAGATRALSRVSFPAAGIRPTMRTIRKTPRMQGAWTTSSQIGSPDLPPKVQTFAGTVHLQAGRHTPPSKRACQARRARRRASFCSIPPCA